MALHRVTFDLKLFTGPDDVKRSRKDLLALMHALSYINLTYIQAQFAAGKAVPSIYKSGVSYQAEEHTEIWQDIPTLLENRFGDCEDLACWRVAELNFAGIKAKPYLKWRNTGPRQSVMHATVAWPDGRIEDPSAALGMNGTRFPPPVFIDPGPMT